MAGAARAEAFAGAGASPPWFHGPKNRGDAEKLLLGQPPGTYLIRESTSAAGSFVLSVSESGRVSHYMINRTAPNVFHIGDGDFTDLPAVIDFYKKHLLDSTTLTNPVIAGASPPPPPAQPIVPQVLFTVQALYNFAPNDSEDLGFTKGDVLEVLEQHEAQWWRARSPRTGQTGCIPVNYVQKIEAAEPEPQQRRASSLQRTTSVMDGPKSRRAAPPSPGDDIREEDEEPQAAAVVHPTPAPRPQGRQLMPDGSERPRFIVARAKTDRVAHAYDKTALSFRANDIIHVTKQNENGLWQGQIVGGDGRSGHFPFTLVQLMDSAEYDAEIAELERKFNHDIDQKMGK